MLTKEPLGVLALGENTLPTSYFRKASGHVAGPGWAGRSRGSVGERGPGLERLRASWPASRLLGRAPPGKGAQQRLKRTRPCP